MTARHQSWNVSISGAFNLSDLEAIAEGIEAGDIAPGAFVLHLEAKDYDRIGPALVRRLGAFVTRRATASAGLVPGTREPSDGGQRIATSPARAPHTMDGASPRQPRTPGNPPGR